MSQAAQHVGQTWPIPIGRRLQVDVNPWIVGSVALGIFALALRLAAADQQSAYMDEGTNVLTGRMLIEQHTVYAEILNWAYGSYLWPLVAGAADMLGGLRLVRAVTALCGVLSVLATATAAARLTPSSVTPTRRWGVALLAGGIMAVAPTAVGVGRFGTYDALAGATFMLGVSLIVPANAPRRRVELLAAAALLFVAFLAKYLVAIYFPVICAYMVFGALRVRGSTQRRVPGWLRGVTPGFWFAARNFLWFVVPLGAACAVYALVFLGPLLALLTSSLHYSDLKSPDPLREYVWTRPEIWVLLGLALLGLRRASWSGRLIGLGGTAVIVAFQIEARPDFDFWKHSIYVIYFLAPLAGLTWLSVPQNTGTWRVLALGSVGLFAVWAWSPTIRQADLLIDFYPNLNPSIEAIDANIAGSALVLTDDTALRYYLYPRMATDRVYGPFFFTYHGQDGLEGYRRAIADRFFDAIVLDGGVTPQGAAFRQQLGQTIQDYYQNDYSYVDSDAFTVEVFKPIRPVSAAVTDATDGPWPVSYTFDTDYPGLGPWGGHPDNGDWHAGQQVAISQEQLWNGLPVLRFAPTADTSTLSVHRFGHVTRVRARVYVTSVDGSLTPIRVGFVGWDSDWQWHDDSFRWMVPPGSWTTITWDLASPGDFAELGLKFPSAVSVVYLGSFEVDP